MGDLLGSVGAIVAAIVIHFHGLDADRSHPVGPGRGADPRSAWKLPSPSRSTSCWKCAGGGCFAEKVEQGLMGAVPGLAAVSHVHVWQLTSGALMATLHVRPNVDEEARAVVKRASKRCFITSIEHATVGIDWNPAPMRTSCSFAAHVGASGPRSGPRSLKRS